MYCVVGSGFGFYGYIPALLECLNQEVILPIEYQKFFFDRKDLAKYHSKINWADNLDIAISQASGLILATTPANQFDLLNKYIQKDNLKRLVLEKPLACSPDQAGALIDLLDKSNKKYSISYSIAALDWFIESEWPIDNSDDLYINWQFLAHHFKYDLFNWKRSHVQGGGVLRFFGIHILAMIVFKGYTTVISSKTYGDVNEPALWTARFSGRDLPECNVVVNSRSDYKTFQIQSSKVGAIVALDDPFERLESIDSNDKRISVLAKIIDQSEFSNISAREFYKKVNKLWLDVELINAVLI